MLRRNIVRLSPHQKRMFRLFSVLFFCAIHTEAFPRDKTEVNQIHEIMAVTNARKIEAIREMKKKIKRANEETNHELNNAIEVCKDFNIHSKISHLCYAPMIVYCHSLWWIPRIFSSGKHPTNCAPQFFIVKKEARIRRNKSFPRWVWLWIRFIDFRDCSVGCAWK